jgi:hypothetical protein
MLRATPTPSHRFSDVSASDLVLDLLATYRLTTLIKDDKIAEPFRHGVFRRFGSPAHEDSHKISYLVTCPWCLSIYFAALAVGARAASRRLWSPVATSLALSALVGLLSEVREHLHGTADDADGE